jgi:hypothetical protein
MPNQTHRIDRKLLAGALLALLAPLSHGQVTVVAKTADSFVDSIGVNAHWPEGDAWSTYATPWTQGLAEIGIRHMRCMGIHGGIAPNGQNQRVGATEARQRIRNACAAVAGGAKMNIVVGQYYGNGAGKTLATHSIQEELDNIQALGIDVVEAISGPNEWDNNHQGISPNSAHLTNLAWAQHLFNYTRDLKTGILNKGWTTTEIYSADSLRDDSHAPLAGLGIAQHFHTLNIHIYPRGSNRFPEDSSQGVGSWTLASHLSQVNQRTTQGYNTKPRVITEHGWIALPTWTGDVQASENVKAKYLIRGSLHYFQQNIKRSYIYCLAEKANNERQLALMSTVDSSSGPVTTKRKSFYTLKDTMALLRDQGNSSNFTTSSLTYTLAQTTNVRSLVLQKRDGRFYLVLWLGVNSYNTANKTDIAVAPLSTTLTFPSIMPLIRTFLPHTNGQTAVSSVGNATQINVSIPDHPLIVEITPQPVVPNGTYKLIARHSGRAASIAGPNKDDGTNIHQWAYYNNLLEQRWTLTHLGGNVYSIITPYSGSAMAVDNGSQSNKANVLQWQYYNRPHFNWLITRGPPGYYYICPTHALDKTLEVDNISQNNGGNIQQFSWTGGTHQQWEIAAP